MTAGKGSSEGTIRYDALDSSCRFSYNKVIFLFKKMNQFRKIPTEREMIDQLKRGEVALPPLSFRYLEDQPEALGNLRFDALVEESWGNSIARFAVECKSLSTPKAAGGLSGFRRRHPEAGAGGDRGQVRQPIPDA